MKKSMKRLVSYVLLLAFACTSVFTNGSQISAATITAETVNAGIQVTTQTVNGNVQTVYTVTKELTQESTETKIHLADGETAVLDGQGHTMTLKTLIVTGSGTLIIKNVSIVYGADGNGIRTEGEYINLVFAGTDPISVKQKEVSNGDSQDVSAIYTLAAQNNITLEDGANVTLKGGNNNNGYGGTSSYAICDWKGTLITVGKDATLALGHWNNKDSFQYLGCWLYVPQEQYNANDDHKTNFLQDKTFTIVPVIAGEQQAEKIYLSMETSVSKKLLPTYFGPSLKLEGYYTADTCEPGQALGDTFDYSGATKTVYAKLKVLKKVTFDTKGGSAVASVDTAVDAKVVKPANPTKSGYTFGGWYKDASYTEEYDFNTLVTDDMTLYAKWNYTPVAEPEPTAEPTTKPTATPPAATSTPKPTGAVKNPAKGATIKGANKTKYIVTSTTKGKTTVQYKAPGHPTASTVTIPNTVKIGGITYKVTSIAANAFRGNNKIKKVIIPDNIKTIGDNAFFKAKNLQSITIGKGLVTIGKHAFCHTKKGCTINIKSTKLKTVKTAQNHGTSKMTVYAPKSKKKTYEKLFTKNAKGITVKAK